MSDPHYDADWYAAVEAAPPSCRCSHAAVEHAMSTKRCRSAACGCIRYRPRETS